LEKKGGGGRKGERGRFKKGRRHPSLLPWPAGNGKGEEKKKGLSPFPYISFPMERKRKREKGRKDNSPEKN